MQNLDGGGSSVSVYNGQVISRPTCKDTPFVCERAVTSITCVNQLPWQRIDVTQMHSNELCCVIYLFPCWSVSTDFPSIITTSHTSQWADTIYIHITHKSSSFLRFCSSWRRSPDWMSSLFMQLLLWLRLSNTRSALNNHSNEPHNIVALLKWGLLSWLRHEEG